MEEYGRLELLFNAQDVACHDVEADRLGRFAPLERLVLKADCTERLSQLRAGRCDELDCTAVVAVPASAAVAVLVLCGDRGAVGECQEQV